MNNTSLLAVIAVLLMGIFTIFLLQYNEETPEERISNSMSNVMDSVAHEIQDDSGRG